MIDDFYLELFECHVSPGDCIYYGFLSVFRPSAEQVKCIYAIRLSTAIAHTLNNTIHVFLIAPTASATRRQKRHKKEDQSVSFPRWDPQCKHHGHYERVGIPQDGVWRNHGTAHARAWNRLAGGITGNESQVERCCHGSRRNRKEFLDQRKRAHRMLG